MSEPSELPDRQAELSIEWLSREAGGREMAPLTGAVYSPTVAFVAGELADGTRRINPLLPQFSLSMDILQTNGLTSLARVRFFFPEQVAANLKAGAEMLVLEGLKPVGKAVIIKLL